MAEGIVRLDVMSGGSAVAVDDIGGTQHQLIKMEFGPSGAGTMVSQVNPLPVSGASTITSGSIVITAGTLTDGTIRIPAGTISVNTPGTITSGSIAVTAGTIVGNVASGVADSGNPLKIGAVYLGTAGTLTSGQRGDLQIDAQSSLKNTLTSLLAGEDQINNVIKVEERYSYNYISTATTTSVKATPGFVHAITVQGGVPGTIIIYDSTTGSGTIIASFDSTAALQTYILNAIALTAITVVTASATKCTVSFR